MGIFDVNGGFVRGLSKSIDIILLSILFWLCSIPIFTMGTAATAFYYTMNKSVKNDRGYVFKEYVLAFKNNFKQTTPVWLLVMVIATGLGLDIYIMQFYGENGSRLGMLVMLFLIMGTFLLVWSLYVFAYMARFTNTRKESMKNAGLIAIANLPQSVMLFLLAIAAGLLMMAWPVSILFVPGLFTLSECFILEKVFWKYMSEEDRAAELERNREFKN